jgi:hypothetical protein
MSNLVNSVQCSFLLFLALLLQLDYHITKKSLSARIYFLTISFSTYLIYVYYTSDLVSLMTVVPASSPITGFEDVLKLGYQGCYQHNIGESFSFAT